MTEAEFFIEAYDEFIDSEADNGAELAKAKHAVALRYAAAVEGNEIERHDADLVAEGEDLFDKYVMPERTVRKSAFRREIAYLIDALHDETILGLDDPRLDQAVPLGDGRDKTLRYWTRDDWNMATIARFKKAAETTAAANEFASLAQQIIKAMDLRGVATTGRLFEPPADSGAA